MLRRRDLKILLRSRSWDFVKNHKKTADGSQGLYRWNGEPSYYRAGTSDCRNIYEILLSRQSEYQVPQDLKPKTVVDISANIGIASIYSAEQFPNFRIFAFEPEEENSILLKKNIHPYQNMRAFPVALGNRDEVKEIFLLRQSQ